MSQRCFVMGNYFTRYVYFSFKKDRQKARDLVGENYIEVFVETSLETLKRDPKGLYKKQEKER